MRGKFAIRETVSKAKNASVSGVKIDFRLANGATKIQKFAWEKVGLLN